MMFMCRHWCWLILIDCQWSLISLVIIVSHCTSLKVNDCGGNNKDEDEHNSEHDDSDDDDDDENEHNSEHDDSDDDDD